ncbi:LITAF-like zinc ribbon domain-containing protein [Glomus cerebriforme]|uniref:LITAF-like zinc ribbon domain-containing protein n=1 Tax=Glomus cerebriforme TaxID=658196 RepID=A0A397TE87_9GLOM|nr:LITAF-like zinc ribbon domain-containing protein [Glomus cerebriforme]
MTSISHQPSTFHYIELKAPTSSSSSSSSSLLSTSSTSSSDNEKNLICKVTNSPCLENLSEKQQRKRKRKARSTTYLPLLKLPDFPVKTQCPNCSKYVVTHVIYKNGTCVYVFAMGLFTLTVVLFWVPFFMDCCKDVIHSCPHCKSTLGTRRRI